MAYQSDSPVQLIEHDRFNRREFATRIAKTLSTYSEVAGLVVSIDGEWGSGKTTVLEFVKERIKADKIAYMEFNPWRYNGEEELLLSFFVDLASRIDLQLLGNGQRLQKVVEEQMPWLSDATDAAFRLTASTVLPAWLIATTRTIAAKAWTSLTPKIDILQKKMKEALEGQNKKIIIFVDDPDRLDGDDLYAFFRLIKLTADLPNVIFLLAMDHGAVVSALSRRFPEGSSYGKQFLEKIVQVPLKLPLIERSILNKYAYDCIQSALEGNGIDIDAAEWGRYKHFYEEMLAEAASTPRICKQYGNVVRFALGLLPKEINPVDVLILEGIRLLFPRVFDVIPTVEHLLFGDTEIYAEDAREKLEYILKKVRKPTDREKKVVLTGFRLIFPQLDSSEMYEVEGFDRLERSRRVSSRYYFWRYFSSSIAGEDVSDVLIDEVFDALREGDSTRAQQMAIKRLEDRGKQLLVVQRMRVRAHILSHQESRLLAEVLAAIANMFENNDRLAMYSSPFGQAAAVVSECIERLPDSSYRADLFKEVLKLSANEEWSITLYTALPRFSEELQTQYGGRQKGASKEEAEAYAEIAGGYVESKLVAKGIECFGDNDWTCVGILLGSNRSDFLRRWTKERCEEEPVFVLQVVGYALPRKRYSDKPWSYAWNGEKALVSVLKTIDRQFLREKLNEVVGKLDIPEKSSGRVTLQEAGILMLKLLNA